MHVNITHIITSFQIKLIRLPTIYKIRFTLTNKCLLSSIRQKGIPLPTQDYEKV
nr:MAG TPA: hypothetical protein [Caudoviricetes sp.]